MYDLAFDTFDSTLIMWRRCLLFAAERLFAAWLQAASSCFLVEGLVRVLLDRGGYGSWKSSDGCIISVLGRGLAIFGKGMDVPSIDSSKTIAPTERKLVRYLTVPRRAALPGMLARIETHGWLRVLVLLVLA